MTRRLKANADTLDEALREVLAELAGVSPGDVDVRLSVAGLDIREVSDVRLELECAVPADSDEAEEETDENEGVGAETEEDDEDDEDDEGPGLSIDDLDEEAEAGADFLEGVLDAIELPGDIQIRVHEDHAEVEVINVGSGRLIGRRGQTLDALQELCRCALQRQFQRRSRVIIDIEGYRARRLEKLIEKAEAAIDDALRTGEEQRLEPMDVFERKAIHRLVAEHDGVTSSSRGREPTRRVVIESTT